MRSITDGIRRSSLELAFRRILRSRHDLAGDLPHMLSGIGKLALQEFRLNLHGFLKIGGVNQLSRVIERIDRRYLRCTRTKVLAYKMVLRGFTP